MSEEHDEAGTKRNAMYVGRVVDNVDPKKLGRVRVVIDGLVEPASAWAWPIGTMGGGTKQRGFKSTPKKGSTVAVFFHMGDVEAPYYIAGHWGHTKDGLETPGATSSDETVTPADAPDVHSFETDKWLIECDDRVGKERLLLKSKAGTEMIELDGNGRTVSIAADVAVSIKCNGNIIVNGLQVVLNGRVVAPKPDPL